MKITVLGCGRWGSFLAWYLDGIGHDVMLWGREGSEKLEGLMKTRENSYVKLSDKVSFTSSIGDAMYHSEYIVISIKEQNLRDLVQVINGQNYIGKTIVLCMKGIEQSTGMRLSEVVKEFLGDKVNVAVWIGPGHAQDFVKGIPSCMVMDSDDKSVSETLVKEFRSKLIRFYYGNDMIGNEIAAASKNVIGIAAGMLDGMGLTSLKGALMARGTREISKLIVAMGGKEITAYGLAGLGDYEATLFSVHSNSRKYGEMLINGETYNNHTPGAYTVKSLMNLSVKYNIELPISKAVYDVIYNNKDARNILDNLFLRDTRDEF